MHSGRAFRLRPHPDPRSPSVPAPPPPMPASPASVKPQPRRSTAHVSARSARRGNRRRYSRQLLSNPCSSGGQGRGLVRTHHTTLPHRRECQSCFLVEGAAVISRALSFGTGREEVGIGRGPFVRCGVVWRGRPFSHHEGGDVVSAGWGGRGHAGGHDGDGAPSDWRGNVPTHLCHRHGRGLLWV